MAIRVVGDQRHFAGACVSNDAVDDRVMEHTQRTNLIRMRGEAGGAQAHKHTEGRGEEVFVFE